MRDVYTALKNLDHFEDNEYLQKYAFLVESNARTPQRGGLTNKHHIIPRSWFKIVKKPCNDSLSNLVNLPYRSHVLAHYYLCLCTTGDLQYANELALMLLTTGKQLSVVDKQLINSLPLYNNIYNEHMQKRRDNYTLYEEKNT